MASVDHVRIEKMVKEMGTDAITVASQMVSEHYDYALYAGILAAQKIQRETHSSFSKSMCQLEDVLHPCVSMFIKRHATLLDKAIVPERDYHYDIFGIKTLERAYLLCVDGHIVETPQYMWMRVAIGIHGNDMAAILETYELMSKGYFTHATPTLFHAGTRKPQMSSCFLVAMKDDSIDGIYDTLKECANISKHAGGIGMHIHNIRAKGTHIKGNNGTSDGIVPMLRVFNNTARYVNQGGRRNGSFAIYLEPWHRDIRDFLDLKRNHGAEDIRARDLFYALWIPDLFMQRVKANTHWTLMCPHECPGLSNVWGAAFNDLYTQYEQEKKGVQIKARELWQHILTSQIETGTPYLLYKDACNAKSNQQNVGTIQSSNLCSEIVQYSSPQETAVCNLASVALPKCVQEDGTFDFDTLKTVVRCAVRNLNRVIDGNYYPTVASHTSNMRHRPIGLGVQGLADVFQMMGMAFDSKAAATVNRHIFETMYFAALTESVALARKEHYTYPVIGHQPYRPKGTYESYHGSPASKGLLQFDLWGVTPSDRHNWEGLKADIKQYGLRNSLLLSIMPTASTSQILGNNECCEPYTSNVYVRRVLSGEYIVINKHLCKALEKEGLWTSAIKQHIIANRGSIQNVPIIPNKIKRIFKTVWEIKQKALIDMAISRAPYICQSQSMNLFMSQPTIAKLTSMHFYAWEKGLKTGCYYLRTQPATDAIPFTVEPPCQMCSS